MAVQSEVSSPKDQLQHGRRLGLGPVLEQRGRTPVTSVVPLRRLLPAWAALSHWGYGELANPPQSGALSAAGAA